MRIFDPLGLALVRLVLSRDELRAGAPSGIPMLTEAVDALTDYLVAEQRHGRVVAEASSDGR